MKINITSKNYRTSDYLKETIEKKLAKLDKYFADDVLADVMVSKQGNKARMEATIRVKGTIFRAEHSAEEAYDCIEIVVDKLSSQMSRFKTKLQNKHKDNKEIQLAELPTFPEEEIKVVKVKKFELTPMTVDEAIMQMELLEHEFYVFLNMESDGVCVVYKRKNGDYGLLETTR